MASRLEIMVMWEMEGPRAGCRGQRERATKKWLDVGENLGKR